MLVNDSRGVSSGISIKIVQPLFVYALVSGKSLTSPAFLMTSHTSLNTTNDDWFGNNMQSDMLLVHNMTRI